MTAACVGFVPVAPWSGYRWKQQAGGASGGLSLTDGGRCGQLVWQFGWVWAGQREAVARWWLWRDGRDAIADTRSSPDEAQSLLEQTESVSDGGES